jgi:hypothetical protein
MPQDDIVKLAHHYPVMTVYSPPPPERPEITAGGLRKRLWKRRHEPEPVQAWRVRMASGAPAFRGHDEFVRSHRRYSRR